MRKILLTVLAVSTFTIAVSSNSADTATAATASTAAVIGETAPGKFAKCRIPPFKEAYADAKAVFVGKVLSVTQNERGKTFEFQVEKYWKGSRVKKASVSVFESSRFQAIYEEGKRYLVFASANGEGGLIDGRCSRSDRIADAAADLKALGRAKTPR